MNHSFLSHKSLLSVALSASLLAGLTSCQDEDFGYSADQIKYAKNFVERYGAIPADKSWDMSSSAGWVDVTKESSGGTRALGPMTRAASPFSIPEDKYYEVDNSLLSWMTDQLKEGFDNRYLGSSFVLRVPENGYFAIIPIYQGNSSIMSELEVKINGYDLTKVWTKSDDVWVKKDGSDDWKEVGHFSGSRNWDRVEEESATWTEEDDKKWTNSRNPPAWRFIDIGDTYYRPSYPLEPASTIGAEAVKTKPIIFSGITPTSGAPYMYLSLHNIGKNPQPQHKDGYWDPYEEGTPNRKWVQATFKRGSTGYIETKPWDENDEWTTVGDRLTSIHSGGYMLALNVPADKRPNMSKLKAALGLGADQDPQCLIVGCEDANGAASDHDNNDVVFLVVGYPTAPQIVPTSEVIRKRYMCEDLGGTDDFDFNDVVVDMTQIRYLNITSTTGTTDSFFNTGDAITSGSSVEIAPITDASVTKVVQTAKIAHVCGTIPLQVRVGDYFFPKISDPTNEYQTRTELSGPGYTKKTKDSHDLTRGEVKGNGWNPNEEKIITDILGTDEELWDPQKNNIKIYADWSSRPGGSVNESVLFKPSEQDIKYADFTGDYNTKLEYLKTVAFPVRGEVPYILAMDQTIPWMSERESIPREWVVTGDMSTNRDDKNPVTNNPIIAPPSSEVYYANYGSDKSEAILWSGSVKGAQNITVVDLSSATSRAGLTEVKSKYFNVVKVYTKGVSETTGDHPKQAVGKFSLCYKDGSDWKSLFDGITYPNVFQQEINNSRSFSSQEYVNSILLTEEQLAQIASNGLGVVSRTNGLEITKVTMYRIWDHNDNVEDKSTLGYYQMYSSSVNNKARILNIKATGGGAVSISDRTSNESGFAATNYKALYPYSVSSKESPYSNYRDNGGSLHDQGYYSSKVTLIAQADAGKVFDCWRDDSSTKSIGKVRDIEISKDPGELVYEAVFVTGQDPNFALSGETVNDKGILEINMYVGTSRTVNFTSSNLSTPYEIGSYDNRYLEVHYDNSSYHNSLTIDAKAVGTQEFTVQQPDGHHSGTAYNASAVQKIKVTVRKMPEARFVLDRSVVYAWNSTGADAYIVDKPVDSATNYNLSTAVSGESADHAIFGDINTWGYSYVDLSKAKVLVAVVEEGEPQFCFNKSGEWNGPVTTVNKDHAACTVVGNTYVIDLEKIRSNGATHLNYVGAANTSVPTRISSLKTDVDPTPAYASVWTALKGKLSSATIALAKEDIYWWEGINANATVNGVDPSHYLWNTGVKVEVDKAIICGQDGVAPNHFIDLSSATVLVIDASFDNTATSGLEIVYNNEQWSTSNEPTHHLTGTDVDYCAVVKKDDMFQYVIDLSAIRQKLGISYFHLNGIKLNGTSATINSVKVDSKESRQVNNYREVAAVKGTCTALTLASFGNGSEGVYKVNSSEPEAVNTVYGFETINPEKYADLANHRILKLVVEKDSGTPRFIFNATSSSEYYTVSPTSNSDLLRVENDDKNGTTTYYVMLWAMQHHMGVPVHLNAIKASAYNTTIKALSLELSPVESN